MRPARNGMRLQVHALTAAMSGGILIEFIFEASATQVTLCSEILLEHQLIVGRANWWFIAASQECMLTG